MTGFFGRLSAGAFGRLLLPGIVLQSVLIGGGYASGREVVEFGARFGVYGGGAVIVVFFGFSLMAILTFELARLSSAYEYKAFMRQLIGWAWPAFDLLFGTMAVLIIAVMASAAANIMQQVLGLPPAVGTGLIIVAVGILCYFGTALIEGFKSIGTGLLYIAYLLFAAVVLTQQWPQLSNAFSTEGMAQFPEATAGAALLAGVIYVGYNLAVFPAVLFTLHRQQSRRDTVTAGLIAGAMMTVPFALTWLCLLAYYQSPEVFAAPVPWLVMLEVVGGGWLLIVFALVMGWTLLETSVGLIHALLERIDRDFGPADGGLSRPLRGFLGAGVLLAAAVLSQIGIIALIAQGYTIMGYLFIALFALPLMTIGLARILHQGRQRSTSPIES
ncbi:hypothetical protein G4Y73_12485 [Wenzhouxiangella sp. XN201]|uniref:YkvI family membrane protein n=1 Tax=Wenzhouxiangella sp. XN201 TaxID=2710755 RepID=UPI0013C7A785|nr:hypothetical protein [Wenzhouxiangella sp. XN201]NEZ04967.1 hypothetical protein [Wenzhouxiangella sp. XN201]